MWERRSVYNEEKDKWAPLRPAHMSEEEELEGGAMLRKRPTWKFVYRKAGQERRLGINVHWAKRTKIGLTTTVERS